jgi:hypothetical protein
LNPKWAARLAACCGGVSAPISTCEISLRGKSRSSLGTRSVPLVLAAMKI